MTISSELPPPKPTDLDPSRELDRVLREDLEAIRAQGLYRELRRIDSPQGPYIRAKNQSLLNFSSNDYLGLANDPAVRAAAKNALDTFGAGSGASRLICGSLGPHHVLEETLAAFKNAPAALSFSSGYAAALGAITAVVGSGDVLILDKRCHASIVDAARLSGAKLRVFRHNDPDDLRSILEWADRRAADGPSAGAAAPAITGAGSRPRILVVTESVFSMDGDLALLKELVELKERYGAWLMLDEAHATGLFGEHRRGLAEAFGLADRVDIHLGTLGKALGSSGGYITGSTTLVDALVNKARSFIFSTAPTPAAAAAATEAVRIVQSPEGEVRRKTVWNLVDQLKNRLIETGWALPPVQSAILPLVVGDAARAVQLAARLRDRGIFAPAVRFPTVPRGQARLRLTLTAAHEPSMIGSLTQALADPQAASPSQTAQ